MVRGWMGRGLIGLLGVGLAAYGGWLLLTRGHDRLDVVVWLVAGVLLHDGVIAVATVAVGAAAIGLLPAVARAPVAAALVVLGPVTLLAVPVLGRFGARTDNPTLLDRDYAAGWLALAGLSALAVLVAVLVASLVRSRHARRQRAERAEPAERVEEG